MGSTPVVLVVYRLLSRKVIMCRPVNNMVRQERNCLKKARKVVRKYKKMSLKKEMTRLRQLLPKGESLKQHEVLDQTILLIQELEMKLLTRIKQVGIPPRIAMNMGDTSTQSLDLNKLRNLVMNTMGQKY